MATYCPQKSHFVGQFDKGSGQGCEVWFYQPQFLLESAATTPTCSLLCDAGGRGEDLVVDEVEVVVSHEDGGGGVRPAVRVRQVGVALHTGVALPRDAQVRTRPEHRTVAATHVQTRAT